ncbi:NAD-dependent epimerase/dehydratase family protein [Hyphobacterium indicum]|uniref:NAD-dependent epimerase/dehydratase family protein n=1 Tax=Hyphobacterium indicum TaxID=2162714 RepID=UPI000D659838|nr:NAD(P)-dependent oxidoreductase [Hyphobacterium indicum]
MRILLTGATGYLGGWMLRELSRSHDVVCAVRPGSRLQQPAQTVEWDLATDLPGTFPKVDAIVHAAQSRHYTAFPEGAADAFAINCASTARLLDWSVQIGVERFCLISSGSVYEPYDGVLEETAALAPTSLNGTTKLAAEILTRAYDSEMAVSRLRLFFPYGPGQTQRMVPNIIDRIRKGDSVTLAGQNGLVFSPLFVEDIARIVNAAVNDGWQGSYNIAGPESITLRAFSEIIAEIAGQPAKFELKGADSPDLVASVERLKSRYPMHSMVPVRTGLERTMTGERAI